MPYADKPLPDLLRQLRADLKRTSADALATLTRPRAGLAMLSVTLPRALCTARHLAALSAEALDVADDATTWATHGTNVLSAVRAATNAIAEHVDAPDDFGRELVLTQAGQRLLVALGRDTAEWFRDEAAQPKTGETNDASTSASSDLDAAATLILMVEVNERDEMERIRDHLRRFATDDTAGAFVRGLAKEAESSLCVVLESIDSGHDANEALAAAAECVGKAVRARDEEEDAATRAPRIISAAVAEAATNAVPATDAPTPTSAAVGSVTMDELPEGDHELISEFIMECSEYLESAEAALLHLEIAPGDLEAINTVFRAFHTVKGTSGFLGLHDIANFAHEAESVFSRVRDHEIEFAGGIPDLALGALDLIKALLAEVEIGLSGQPMTRPSNYDAVLQRMASVAGSVAPAEPVLVAPSSPEIIAAARLAIVQDEMPQDDASVLREPRSAASELSIRVSTDRLDRLIDMVGELVIAHTMIAQDEHVLAPGQHELAAKTNHAGKMVRELHDLSLSMRMVPLKPTFQKMTRLVRDVAQGLGKQVVFATEGDETEIDRNMVDALSDPLVHMVRNAIDHGIETPDARAAAGKPRQGTIRLSAKHAGGSVVVQLRDDGKGLDRDRIIAKAMERGLIESAAKMSEAEIFSLIFAPGFSTAEKVTDLSGRGVGMDVVRRNIETLRGRIEIESTRGEGTLFTVRLPLTLAVSDGMLIRVGKERYILPTTSIFKSFRPDREELSTIAGRGEMVRLHDQIMPMFRLHRIFNVPGAVLDPCHALVVVVASGEQRVALLVDELIGQQQIVAKSLGDNLGKIEGVSGAAILGDGRIGLILDIAELLVLVRGGDTGTGAARAVA
ncbi:MAG: chemotaxis protein CheA [bacterium]